MPPHFLHFGVGANLLPEPWQNLDASHDIRKRLRFDDGSAMAIMAEHVIEHVPYKDAIRFFTEAHRVLDEGGVLRVSFPDVSRFVHWWRAVDTVTSGFTESASSYALLLEVRENGHPKGRLRARGAMALLLTGWGHEMAWTRDSAAAALLVAGYRQVRVYDYGGGRFGEFDGHHKDVGLQLARYETTVLEATK